MISREWKLKDQPSEAELAKYGSLNKTLSTLLWQRGVDHTRAGDFLSFPYDGLYDPFLFRQMPKVVDRIWKAVENKEQILIYADYDADAVTACSVMLRTFEYLGVEAKSYIPDRFTEGYGLNLNAFERFAEEGVDLVITVDCGINSRDEALKATSLGMDLVITDHHELIGETPSALAVINPKISDSGYPDDQITGVGVAFKLACALLADHSKVSTVRSAQGLEHVVGWEKWLLDLVAVGTVADCHSLLGENRLLVHYGLKVLAKSKWSGLSKMLDVIGVDRSSLSTHTLGFLIAPRINAAGRLEHANIALDTLLAEDETRAEELVLLLEQINTRRQEATLRTVSEAKEQAGFYSQDKVLVLSSSDWHKGLVGIVAGRLAEDLSKPAIVLAEEGEQATGSARSFGGFDIVSALNFCSDLLVKFGGHKQAAGLTLQISDIAKFRLKINDFATNESAFELAKPMLELDAVLDVSELNLDLVDQLSYLEPFGAGNPKPIFIMSSLQISNLKKVGKDSNHLQVVLEKNGKLVSGIAFQKGFWFDMFKAGDRVNVAAEVIADAWNGIRRVKINVVDLKKEA